MPSTLVALRMTWASISSARSTPGGVGGKERIAGAGGEDDEPALFEVADGAAPDVRLGQRFHPDGGHDPGVDADLLQNVLEREGVDDGGQHAHVVGGDPVESLAAGGGPANDVAAADHERQAARPARGPP